MIQDSTNVHSKIYEVKTLCYQILLSDFHNLPDSREGSSLNCFKNKSYYIGGFGAHKCGAVSIFDHGNLAWNKVKFRSNDTPEGMFPTAFHSAVIANDCIYIFGGGSKDKLYNSLFEFDIKKKVWNYKRTFGEMIEPRRSHIACYIGQGNMAIHGGTGANDGVLSSSYYLNFQTFKWSTIGVGLLIGPN